MLNPRVDYLTKYGAGIIAATIEKFWNDRGAVVKVERYEIAGMPEVYGVRSNLVAGKPAK